MDIVKIYGVFAVLSVVFVLGAFGQTMPAGCSYSKGKLPIVPPNLGFYAPASTDRGHIVFGQSVCPFV